MDAGLRRGRSRIAALRAPDFYGPGVGSYLGDTSIGAMAKGKAAFFLGSPDIPHDYAYVPDIGRATASLLEAPDSAYGQAWHVPCAPTRTTREILKLAADALGVRLRLNVVPAFLLGPLGLVVPIMRERKEMGFTFDRPYRVELEQVRQDVLVGPDAVRRGVRKTALAFRTAAGGPEPFRQSSSPRRTSVEGTKMRGSRPGLASPSKYALIFSASLRCTGPYSHAKPSASITSTAKIGAKGATLVVRSMASLASGHCTIGTPSAAPH